MIQQAPGSVKLCVPMQALCLYMHMPSARQIKLMLINIHLEKSLLGRFFLFFVFLLSEYTVCLSWKCFLFYNQVYICSACIYNYVLKLSISIVVSEEAQKSHWCWL